MLEIKVGGVESYDDSKQEFVIIGGTPIQLEHSLVSLSKWEQEYEKPFISTTEKTDEELVFYVKCMTLTPEVPEELYLKLSDENIQDINDYINKFFTTREAQTEAFRGLLAQFDGAPTSMKGLTEDQVPAFKALVDRKIAEKLAA